MDNDADLLRELAELGNAIRNLTVRVFELEQRELEQRELEQRELEQPELEQRHGESSPPRKVETASPAPPSQPEATVPILRPSVPPTPPPMPVIPPRVASASPHGAGPDLESRIGSQWLNRIGITALLIGVSYFLKYAFDNNWIGASGRVTIGLLAGIAVVVWSEWFRGRGHTIFSYSLKAVGVGALYLSLWAAFQVYHLVPSGVAFFAMFLVTAATAVMAWSQDAEILAAFALAGGFSTPLLLATGENHELALFAYVALLDVAALLLVVLRPWRRLLWMSLSGTLLLYIAWNGDYYRRDEFSLTAVFATLFFVIFAIAPVVVRSPGSGAKGTLPGALSLINAGVYFLQMYVMLFEIEKTSSAWVAVALAAFYLYLSRIPVERYGDPALAPNLRLLHLAIAVGFITVAIPIYLNSHWITMGWLVEAAVLLFVAERVHSQMLTVFSLGALALGVVRLLAIDDFAVTQVVFNARLTTYAVAVGVLGLLVWFGRRRGDDVGEQMAAVASVSLNVLALWALDLEIRDYFGAQASTAGRDSAIARDFSYSALWMAYGAMLMIIGFLKRRVFIRWQALALIAATICKVFVYDLSSLDRGYRIVSFMALGVLLLAISFVYQRDWLKLAAKQSQPGSS